jgi:hypothetical protein
LELSEQAQQLLAADAGPAGAPPPLMVEHARRLLADGFYNDRGVLERTAERLAPLFTADA